MHECFHARHVVVELVVASRLEWRSRLALSDAFLGRGCETLDLLRPRHEVLTSSANVHRNYFLLTIEGALMRLDTMANARAPR